MHSQYILFSSSPSHLNDFILFPISHSTLAFYCLNLSKTSDLRTKSEIAILAEYSSMNVVKYHSPISPVVATGLNTSEWTTCNSSLLFSLSPLRLCLVCFVPYRPRTNPPHTPYSRQG